MDLTKYTGEYWEESVSILYPAECVSLPGLTAYETVWKRLSKSLALRIGFNRYQGSANSKKTWKV